MGQRYAREPITLHVCADCGVYVANPLVHDAWHSASHNEQSWVAVGGPVATTTSA